MKLKTILIIGLAIPLLILIAEAVAWVLYPTANIEVVNNSGRDLSNVRLVTFDSKGERIAESQLLAPKEKLAVNVHTSDLYLREVSFTLDGKIITERLNGMACWRETLTIRVLADGRIEMFSSF